MEKFTPKYKLNEEQLNQLKQVVPEAFKDNELDFNSLYEALSDFTENEEDDIEQFGLSWPGKRAAKRAAAIPPVGTLVPVPGEGVDEEKTHNIYIEGDNLEVLKIIKKAYQGKIKMIYIDPPYNTGTDLIYPDDFSESVESYQKRTGQVDKDGVKMTSNKRSDGRFHSKWCSMIYPRLRLARELLSGDGVIFISIDDNEVAQLLKICDEIFGEGNFVGKFIWRKKEGGGQAKEHFVVEHEYILVYRKNDEFVWKDKEEERNISEYKKSDDNGIFKITKLAKWGNTARREDRPTMYFPLIAPDNSEVYPVAPDGNDGRWRVGKERMNEIISSNLIYWEKKDDYWIPYEKEYFANQMKIIKQRSILYDLASTGDGSNILTSLFEKKDFFENPKPIELLIVFIKHVTQSNSIILDFFSGSSTTAHAVMQLNAEDSGNRKYIMVQIPEICDKDSEAAKAGFKNICEIGKERIRRAVKKVKKEAGFNADNIDTGFKVFRLAPTNCKAWENYTDTDIKQLEELFKEDSLKPGWKEDDLLTEVMLLEGFPLDSIIEKLPQFNKNKVKKINSDFRENTIYICLDKEIHKETINALNLTDNDRFICLDTAVDDQSKITLEDKHFIKTL
jgi:adenine-specific DNA-methyltransferase